MPSQFDQVYKVDKSTVLNADVLNVRFRNLDLRLVGLEALNISWQAALAIVQDKVLAASELVLSSLRDQLVEVTQLEWLVAGSDTPLTLSIGALQSLVVLPDDRALFAPGPFSVLSTVGDANSYAVVRSVSYTRDIGQYNFTVESIAGSPGPNADWQIAAVAGSTLAQRDLLSAQQAATGAAQAAATATAADRVKTDADVAATAEDRTAVHQDRQAADASASSAASSATDADASARSAAAVATSIQGGPVASINGKKGVVTLGVVDIPGAASTAAVTAMLNALVNGAPGVLDTLKELADAIGDDPNFAATISAALNNRVRADAPQAFGAAQQATARRNIRAASRNQALAYAIAF